MTTTYRSSKDIAALIRESLRRELPGWKFSVTFQSYSGGSSITVALMQGKEEVTVNGHRYAQLNHYAFGSIAIRNGRWNNGVELSEIGWEVMANANEIMSREHWDKSDSMTDYFYCNFYRHLNIGKWDKPYQVKGK